MQQKWKAWLSRRQVSTLTTLSSESFPLLMSKLEIQRLQLQRNNTEYGHNHLTLVEERGKEIDHFH